MPSANLGIDYVAAAQNQKEIPINGGFDAIDAAVTEVTTLDLSTADVTLTAAQFRRAIAFRTTGNAAARNLTVPQAKRFFVVINAGTASLSVRRGTGVAAVAAGQAVALQTDATANGIVAVGGVAPLSSAAPKPLGAAAAGTATDGARADHVHPAADLAGAGTTGVLPLAKGGTGGSTAPAALANLGGLAKAGDTLSGDLLTAAGVRISTGGAAQAGISGVVADIQSNSTTAAGLATARWSADPSPARMMLAKSYGTAVGSHVAVPSGTTLGELSLAGSMGAGMVAGAAIDALAMGAGTASGIAAALRLFTSGGGAPVERARLDNLGNFQMGGANTVIDAQRIARLRSYTLATLPAASSAPQGVVDCSDLGGGSGPLYSDGATWQRLQELSSYVNAVADAAATLTVLGSASVVAFIANLLADRAVTLSTTGAYLGAMKRIINAGTGPGRLVCSGITVRPGCFADFMYTGAAWTCVASGVRNDAMQVYETGVWTPALTGSTTQGTQTMHANNSGNYIRVGQMVVAVAYIQWSAIDPAAAGDVVISGLPFAAANVPNNLPTAAVTAQTIAYPAGQLQIIARFRGPNGTAVSPLFSGSGIGQAFVQMSQLSATGIMSFTIVYRTN